MPCEIKELVINTTVNQTDSSYSFGDNSSDESYLRKLIAEEINKAKGKIIQDTIEVFYENNRLTGQR